VRKHGESLFKDVDAARNGFISVVLDRRRESVDAFFALHASHEMSVAERLTALELMELERHSMLMYTSCGWFFDEISGLETEQVIAYAARVLQLACDLFGEEGAALEVEFVRQMAAGKSNIPEQGDGAAVYNRVAKDMQLGLEQVGAHYAISSVFKNYPDQSDLFCYTIQRLAYEVETSGRGRLEIGKALISSKITEEQETVVFAVLHFGDQNITAAVKPFREEEAASLEEFIRVSRAAIIRADIPEVIRGFDRQFPQEAYSIQSLFKDEQQRIVELILQPRLKRVEASLASIYEDQASLLHFLSQSGLQRPPALTLAATFAINGGMRRALESEPIDAIQMRTYLGLAQSDQVTLDRPLLSYIADQKMKRAMVKLQKEIVESTECTATLENALLVARTVTELPFELNLWHAQNLWYDAYRRLYPTWSQIAAAPLPVLNKWTSPPAQDAGLETNGLGSWQQRFLELGRLMGIAVDDLVIEEEETPTFESALESLATESPKIENASA
jgi:uncharacterized protein DUF3536